MKGTLLRHKRFVPALLAVAVAAVGATMVGRLVASDHQDTVEVELDQKYDLNDVYVFPAATAGRVVLAMNTASPLTPAKSLTTPFRNRSQELYQFKIDNDLDGLEDLVLQVTFSGSGSAQMVTLRGPRAPVQTGTTNSELPNPRNLMGPVNTILGTPGTIQLFAGPRDDPFFIDLEQFFRIIPDRKPVTGPLSKLPDTPTATSFRSQANAEDYIAGFNGLAIVIELPLSMLLNDPAVPSKFGVWGTTSRAQ